MTVLVGVGLALLRAHREGRSHGPLNPGDVVVDVHGRPGLPPCSPVPGWGRGDDTRAWLRLAAGLAGPQSTLRRLVAGWVRDGGRRLEEMLPELLTVAQPEPLTTAGQREAPPVRGRRRSGRHAARTRSWGGRRCSRPR